MRPRRASEQAAIGLERHSGPIAARRGHARPLAFVAALVVILSAAPSAGAQPGGLLVAPSRIEAKVRPGDRLPAIQLSNRTGAALTVRVFAARATQDLSGLPVFDTRPEDLRAGARLVRVAPRRLRLGRGERGEVRALVGRPRRSTVGAYAVIAFSAQPARASGRRGAVIAPTIRITTNLLLRFPGPVRLEGEVTAVRAEQGPERTLRFFGRIRNDGNLHVRPRARLTVRSAAGETVLRRRFRPETVLPDAARELPLLVAKRLPAGDYTARVDARVGRRRSKREARFRLVGPNLLPTADLKIISLPTPQPDAGEEFSARVEVANRGTGPIRPAATVTVSAPGSGRRVAERQLTLPSLGPRSRHEAEVELPGLAKGRYELAARFSSGGRVVANRTLVFETGTRPPLLTRVKDWMAGHVPLVVAIFALLLAIVVGGLLAYIRRLRRVAQRAG